MHGSTNSLHYWLWVAYLHSCLWAAAAAPVIQVGLLPGARQDELWGHCFPDVPPNTGQGGHSGLYIGPSPTSWLQTKRYSLYSLGLGIDHDSQQYVFTSILCKEMFLFFVVFFCSVWYFCNKAYFIHYNSRRIIWKAPRNEDYEYHDKDILNDSCFLKRLHQGNPIK